MGVGLNGAKGMGEPTYELLLSLIASCRSRLVEKHLPVSKLNLEQAELGMAAKVVLNISRPFHNTNCHLYFDKFFNSMVLLDSFVTVWYDKHQVVILSTNCQPETVKVQRQTKEPPHINGPGYLFALSLPQP